MLTGTGDGRPLATLPVVAVDIQTTGATPAAGRILEVAWSAGLANPQGSATTGRILSRVLRGDNEETIPARILKLTGITREEVATGIPEARLWRVWSRQLADARPDVPKPVMIAHYARFEQRFLADFYQRHAGGEWTEPVICTHALVKRLWPELPSGSLRAVAGWLGHPLPEKKRATDHVAATLTIWEAAVKKLHQQDIHTLGELIRLLGTKDTGSRGRTRRAYPMDREQRLALPDSPGVYRMLAADGRVLYVGKATSLRDRVNSYFRQQKGHRSHKLELLTQAVKLDVTVCATELEAALLETDEIKRLDPPYNIALRAESRSVGWLDRQLRPAPTEAGVYGPFSPATALEPLTLIVEALTDPVSGLAPLKALVWREVSDESLTMGLAMYAALLGLDATVTPRRILALVVPEARRRERERLIAAANAAKADGHQAETDDAEDGEDEVDEDTEAAEEPLTPEEVCAWLTRLSAAMGSLWLRSRRLRQLANAEVAWPMRRDGEPGPWRWLRLAGGDIVDRGTIDPVPEGRMAVKMSTNTAAFAADIATFDRLRTLYTGLQMLGIGVE